MTRKKSGTEVVGVWNTPEGGGVNGPQGEKHKGDEVSWGRRKDALGETNSETKMGETTNNLNVKLNTKNRLKSGSKPWLTDCLNDTL